MRLMQFARPAAAGALLVAGTSGALPVQDGVGTFRALEELELGAWELRELNGGAVRRICLRDAVVLLRPRLSGAQCTQRVIENTGRTATVQYSCAGRGTGRTTVLVETPRLARIDAQGIEAGAPFLLAMEARRVGPCN